MNEYYIKYVCKMYGIKNYTINDDLTIDVDGDVFLSSSYKKNNKYINIDKFPIKFNFVKGDFWCNWTNFTSLEGAPIECRSFYGNNMKIKNLEFSPKIIHGDFFVYGNLLESINGIPLDIPMNKLYLPKEYTYNDYEIYCNNIKRDLKFKNILKYI